MVHFRIAFVRPTGPSLCVVLVTCCSWLFVDDLHWHTDAQRASKELSMSAASVVLSTYAHMVPKLYPAAQVHSRGLSAALGIAQIRGAV